MADQCLLAVICLKEAAGGRLCGDIVSPVAGVWPEAALGKIADWRISHIL